MFNKKKFILSNKLCGLPLKPVLGFARGRRSWCCALINSAAEPGNSGGDLEDFSQ